MSTRNIVPRANGEGSIGTEAKHWGHGYFNHITTNDMVSVKDYGARGDGITDDTAAIEKCITENNVIFFPVGTYLMDFVSPILEKKTLIGASRNDVIIKQHNSNKAFCIIGHYTQIFQIQFVATNNTEETPILHYQPTHDNTPADFRESELGYLRLVCNENTIGILFQSVSTQGMWDTHITHIQMWNPSYGIKFATNGWYTGIYVDNVCIFSPFKYGVYTASTVWGSFFSNITVECGNNSINTETNEGCCGFYIVNQSNTFVNLSTWNDNSKGRTYSIEYNKRDENMVPKATILGGHFEGELKGDKNFLSSLKIHGGYFYVRDNNEESSLQLRGEQLAVYTPYSTPITFLLDNTLKTNASDTFVTDDIGKSLSITLKKNDQLKVYKSVDEEQKNIFANKNIISTRLLLKINKSVDVEIRFLPYLTFEVNIADPTRDTDLPAASKKKQILYKDKEQEIVVVDSAINITSDMLLDRFLIYDLYQGESPLEYNLYGGAFYTQRPLDVYTINEALKSVGM